MTELIHDSKEVNPKVANELAQIVTLLGVKQDASAILKLKKVIDNLLKELFKDDPVLLELAKANKRKAPSFSDYLEHAKNKKIITMEDYHLLSIVKSIRNEEAHELDIQKHKSKILVALITGVSLAMSLCRLLKKSTIEPTPR